MIPIEIRQEINELYFSKKATRKEIAEKYNYDYKKISRYIKNKGVKFWDSERLNQRKIYDEIIPLYIAKKITRREIVNKYGIKLSNITTFLVSRKILIWDYMVRKEPKPEQTKKEKKYFSWKFETNYGRMIAGYNK